MEVKTTIVLFPLLSRGFLPLKKSSELCTSDTGILCEEHWVVRHLEVLEVRMTGGGGVRQNERFAGEGDWRLH